MLEQNSGTIKGYSELDLDKSISRTIIGPITEVQGHKVASVAAKSLATNLTEATRVQRIATADSCMSGDLVAVQVRASNAQSQPLELGSGRLASVHVNDIVIGVLGDRRALKAFVGTVPAQLRPGDSLHILNLGGVLGELQGSHYGLAAPVQVSYLGHILTSSNQVCSLKDRSLAYCHSLHSPPPLVLVAGTCMQAGKTRVAGELVRHFNQSGLQVGAAKLTGIACMRDTLFMEDCGAFKTLTFVDCGLPSTVETREIAPIAKTIISSLQAHGAEIIVLELGDGILGGYHVDSLFDDAEIMAASVGTVLCANDFVGAWGGIEYLKRGGITVSVISGPATDSPMATSFIESSWGVPAANGLSESAKIFDIINERRINWLQTHAH